MNDSSVRAERTPANAADLDLFEFIEKTLYTAVISDSLDELGYRDQALREFMRPLSEDDAFAGWARTLACVDVFHIPANPYEMEIAALDSVLEGEVVVASTAGSLQNAPWGELLSTAARARGARGAVIDGLVRDVRKIRTLGFPVFARGIKPVDSKGRGMIIDYNVPIICAGVRIQPGDLIFADYDGVVAIPSAILPEVIEAATDKVMKENGSRARLMEGATLRDVFDKYGVL
ncbi:MAG: RraA family protein [Acidobacteria bacterium]|nr:RraA family protein [Acidobacteriota bacterium]